MPQYQTKHKVVDAIQYLETAESWEECLDFVGENLFSGTNDDGIAFIKQDEKKIIINKYDYIIKSIENDCFYVFNPNVFENVYENIKDEDKDKDEIIFIGTLNREFGYKGFEIASIGSYVYEYKDRYYFNLKHINTTNRIKQSFYKEPLRPYIDFNI